MCSLRCSINSSGNGFTRSPVCASAVFKGEPRNHEGEEWRPRNTWCGRAATHEVSWSTLPLASITVLLASKNYEIHGLTIITARNLLRKRGYVHVKAFSLCRRAGSQPQGVCPALRRTVHGEEGGAGEWRPHKDPEPDLAEELRAKELKAGDGEAPVLRNGPTPLPVTPLPSTVRFMERKEVKGGFHPQKDPEPKKTLNVQRSTFNAQCPIGNRKWAIGNGAGSWREGRSEDGPAWGP